MWKGYTLLAATEAGSRIRAKLMALSIYVLAGIVGFVGVIFALIALMIWLSQSYSPLTSSLIITGGLFALAIVLVVVARFQKAPPSRTSPLSTTAMLAAPMALKAVSSRVSFTTVAAVAAIALGALVGRRIARD